MRRNPKPSGTEFISVWVLTLRILALERDPSFQIQVPGYMAVEAAEEKSIACRTIHSFEIHHKNVGAP
jgi:hypothetical protein